METVPANLRPHTHELVRKEWFESKVPIPDILGASFEMWIASSELKRQRAIRALEARRVKYEKLTAKL